MEETMKKIAMGMNIRMGLVMSFCMSLLGNLIGMKNSGKFSIVGFLLSFVISTVISFAIGFLIPMGKMGAGALRRFKLQRGSLPARLLESLISNCIYTPIITLVMVILAYRNAMRQSGGMAQISFLPMFLSSLVICFIVGYVIIFIIQPLFMKQLMKKYGVNPKG